MHEAYNPPSPPRHPGRVAADDSSGAAPPKRVRAPDAIVFDGDSTLAEGQWMYDGVREMLTALASAGYPLAVLTSGESRTSSLLEATLPPGAFEVLYVNGDPGDSTGRTRALLAAGERLETEAPRIVLITGSLSGLHAGRSAGMPIGAAVWSQTDPGERERYLARLLEHAPEWVFETPADVTREFARWC